MLNFYAYQSCKFYNKTRKSAAYRHKSTNESVKCTAILKKCMETFLSVYYTKRSICNPKIPSSPPLK